MPVPSACLNATRHCLWKEQCGNWCLPEVVCLHIQAAAIGQTEVAFLLEDHAVADTARPDLRCFINGVESHPGEAKARNVSSNPLYDPVGIHSNKDAFGKVSRLRL